MMGRDEKMWVVGEEENVVRILGMSCVGAVSFTFRRPDDDDGSQDMKVRVLNTSGG